MSPKPIPENARAGIYARVSTLDKGQDPETQLLQLRDHAERRGWKCVELVDFARGAKDARPNYDKLLALARRREIDVVLVWRYDRFARSTQELVNRLNEFRALGVHFISLTEQIDTSTPQGELMFTITAGFAQHESRMISERVKAGMERAKKQGKHVGRRPLAPAVQRQIRELCEQDVPVREIQRRLEVPWSTVQKYVVQFKNERKLNNEI